MTVFMGVPTMYAYLLSTYRDMDTAQQRSAQAAARRCAAEPCSSLGSAFSVWNELCWCGVSLLLQRWPNWKVVTTAAAKRPYVLPCRPHGRLGHCAKACQTA